MRMVLIEIDPMSSQANLVIMICLSWNIRIHPARGWSDVGIGLPFGGSEIGEGFADRRGQFLLSQFRILWWLLLLNLFLPMGPMSSPSLADPHPSIQAPAAEDLPLPRSRNPLQAEVPAEDEIADEPLPMPRRLEKMHSDFGDRILDLSDRLDDFFGDPRLESEAGLTRYRVRSELLLGEGGGLNFGVKVRGHAVFPRTRQRLGFFLESVREDVLTDFEDLLGDPAENPDGLIAAEDVSGLRAALFSNQRGRLSLDGGLKLSKDPKTRVRLRWQEDHDLDNLWSVRFIQSLEHREESGFGERSQLRFERAIEDQMIRFGLEGVWFEAQPFEAIFTTSYFVPIDERTVLRFNGDLTGILGNEPARTGVGVGIGIRRRLYKEWLFGEIAPRVFWPDRSIEGSDVTLLLVTEVIFGR
jgi:hypothetical protein